MLAFASGAQNSTIKNLKSQRKKAMEEIEAITEIRNKTSKSIKDALSRLNLLSQQIKSREEIINILNREIESMDKEIMALEKEIIALENSLKSKKIRYAKALQHISFQNTEQDKLLWILAGNSFAQSFERIRHLREYADWQKKQGIEISEKQTELKKQNQKLTESKKDKLALIHLKEKEENNLKKEETLKQSEVKTLTAKEKDLKKELDKKKKQAEALARKIDNAIAEEIAKANAEAEKTRRANAEAEKANKTNEIREVRQAESAGGYAMTKEERLLSSDFANNKGRLPFPLKGKYRITSRFGLQNPDGLKHVTLNNNGIDILTTPDNEAKSVFNGYVSKVVMVPGYNQLVIVRHGNYLSIYGNLSNVYVKPNEKVKTGQALGKIFTDSEDGNATVLHFELRKERTKLNPERWLYW